jgi:HD-GYP domain-containing protein (c-di-GMP phosphodiesterase class II)
MRRVPTRQLRTGDRIGRDVLSSSHEIPLLRAGIRVSDSYRESLLRSNITSVWIDDGLSEGIKPLEMLGERTKRQATAAIHGAFRDVSRSLVSGGPVPSDALLEMEEVAELICADVSANVHSALALNDLANADGYTMKHSLAVTALGLSLGLRVMRRYGWIDTRGYRRFDGIDERLSTLGVGLLLHDIGKLAVPVEILEKPGPLTAEEWLAMRAHPALGAQMLQHADGISPVSRAVVRSHHERWDGGGYPAGLAGAAIHQFARIASVADVFDALTSDRTYRHALPMHEGYAYIVSRAGRDFDPEVVAIFAESVAPHPPGTGVVLSDGRCGIVKEVRAESVTRPIIRLVLEASGTPIAGEEIDLSLAKDITIVSTDFDPFGSSREQAPIAPTWPRDLNHGELERRRAHPALAR